LNNIAMVHHNAVMDFDFIDKKPRCKKQLHYNKNVSK
jgi:hypothetical protein